MLYCYCETKRDAIRSEGECLIVREMLQGYKKRVHPSSARTPLGALPSKKTSI